MKDLETRFLRHVRDNALFTDARVALVAVSGGSDSLALLDLMVRLVPHAGLELVVGHIDHGIQPRSADVAEAVLGIASRYKVPARTDSLHLGPETTETQAREARYAALNAMMVRVGADCLVTGHHADDQVETVLLRVLKGTGPAGLAGMRPRRDQVVRPLLPFDRSELRMWVETEMVDFIGRPVVFDEDPMNQDLTIDRSWVRGALLPRIRDHFGAAVDGRVGMVARRATADREAWSALLRIFPGLDFQVERNGATLMIEPLLTIDKSLAQAILRAMLFEAGGFISYDRSRRLVDELQSTHSGARYELGQGWMADNEFGRLRIFRITETSVENSGIKVSWGEKPSGVVRFGDWEIVWGQDACGALRRKSMTTWVPQGQGLVRPPEPGDRMVPLGGVGRRKVVELLREGRVPRSTRAGFPVVTHLSDIIWLPGVCRADVGQPKAGEPAIRIDVKSV